MLIKLTYSYGHTSYKREREGRTISFHSQVQVTERSWRAKRVVCFSRSDPWLISIVANKTGLMAFTKMGDTYFHSYAYRPLVHRTSYFNCTTPCFLIRINEIARSRIFRSGSILSNRTKKKTVSSFCESMITHCVNDQLIANLPLLTPVRTTVNTTNCVFLREKNNRRINQLFIANSSTF